MKKNDPEQRHQRCPLLEKMLNIMKLTTLLLLAILFQVSANTYSQTRLSLKFEKEKLENVFNRIEANSEYSIFYKNDLIQNSKEVSGTFVNASVFEILEQILKNENLTYTVKNKLIMIVPRNDNTQNVTFQQQKTVSGKVTDSTGAPLPGVSVTIKSTTNGTITDANGNYSLKISAGGILVFSFVGMKTQEIDTGGKTTINVALNEETVGLEEVVAVGYGTMEKKQVTSSISSVSKDNLVQGVGGASIATALQGKVSGLLISGTDSPNSGNTFQLRGIASINAGQNPLVVIDGMPGGDIRSVIQEDILSVDVLKDASAGAIYGTRAAGGVILITTKQGQEKEGKVKITYSGELAIKQERNKPKVLSAEEYIAHNRGKDYGSSVDWWDELLNDNPISQKHVFSLDGGNKNTQIYSSFMYNENIGIAVDDKRDDYAGRFNANYTTLDGWLELKTHVNYRQAHRNNNAPNFQQALRNNPTRSPYDATSVTGYNVWLNETMDYNVLSDSKLYKYDGLDKWFNPDVTVKLNIFPIKGLSLQQTVGYENLQWNLQTYRSKYHREELENNRKGTAYIEFSKTENLSSEGYATYVNNFGKHLVNVVAGYSFYKHNGEGYNMTNYNFTNDAVGVWNIGEGTYLSDGEASMSSSKDITERLFSLYARANYSFADKYILTSSVRREGSSKFAENNRWATFWSVSGGWHISKESFLKNIQAINDLKLRVGYGVTGNNSFGADYAATMYGSDAYWLLPSGTWAYTYGKTKNINNDLKWEEQHEWNAGLDYSLFNKRIYGKFDIYRRKVKGMIYSVQVSQPPYIEQTMYKNIGNMQNQGWEFEIGGDVVRNSKWKYSTSFNFSNNKTKILTLWGNQTYYDYCSFPAPGSPGTAIRIGEGTTIGSFYIWKCAGIDDNGDFLLYDKNGNVIKAADKTTDDKQYCGNYMPKLIVSWNNKLIYKNWDMTVNMRSWIDFDVYNTLNMYFGLPSTTNQLNVLKRAYTDEKYSKITGEKQLCDYFLEDGTFLKIDVINLGYNLNLSKYTKYLHDARFYITVNNVATFTKYTGVDPEVDITGFEGGIEWFSSLYPQTRTYTFGLQLTF
jgi:TonB-dependent starch-binding outer membrane protein SusC